MKLGTIPFDGLYAVYMRCESGDMRKLFSGFAPEDVPEDHREKEVIRLYPFDEHIIVEVKENV